MSFTINDTVSVMKRLNLKQSQFDFVNSKLLHVSRKSEILWQEIKTDLKTLDDLEVQLNKTAGTQNFALIRADVLQYAERQKTYGILTETLRISQRVANLLDIEGDFSIINDQLALLGALPLSSGIVGRTSRS